MAALLKSAHARFFAAFLLLAPLASCIDPKWNCRAVEPAHVKLAGKSYVLHKKLGARIVGGDQDGDTDISTRIIGSGKERRNTYCLVGPSDTPNVHLIVFDGEDAAAIDNRFAALEGLSQVALLYGWTDRVWKEPGIPGPLEGMTRYGLEGFYDLDAPGGIPGWQGRVWGHCRDPSSVDVRASCRIQAALTSNSFIAIDIYGEDVQPERWAEFFSAARELFAHLES